MLSARRAVFSKFMANLDSGAGKLRFEPASPRFRGTMGAHSTNPDMSKKTPAPATIRPIKKLMVANALKSPSASCVRPLNWG